MVFVTNWTVFFVLCMFSRSYLVCHMQGLEHGCEIEVDSRKQVVGPFGAIMRISYSQRKHEAGGMLSGPIAQKRTVFGFG